MDTDTTEDTGLELEMPLEEETTTPEPTEVSPGDTTPDPVETEEPTETEETDADPDAEPPFKPNTKYKVMDKEYEIPKELQAVMKDAASERMVRELYEKAGGLDVVKTKLNDTRVERDNFATSKSTVLPKVVAG